MGCICFRCCSQRLHATRPLGSELDELKITCESEGLNSEQFPRFIEQLIFSGNSLFLGRPLCCASQPTNDYVKCLQF